MGSSRRGSGAMKSGVTPLRTRVARGGFDVCNVKRALTQSGFNLAGAEGASLWEKIALLKLGHDVEFYRLLEAQAEVAQRAARAFLAFTQDFTGLDEKAKAMRGIEHEGDDLTRKLQSKMVATFITPLDKEDMRDLSMALDDVTDAIEAAASRAGLYRLDASRREDLVPMGEVLVGMTDRIVETVGHLQKDLHKQEEFTRNVDEIHKLEKQGDALHRKAVMDLFDTPGADPLTVMKWKEVYDLTEDAFDVAEHVAKVLGDILTKYA